MLKKIISPIKHIPFFNKNGEIENCYGICIAALLPKEALVPFRIGELVEKINKFLIAKNETSNLMVIAPNTHSTIAMAYFDWRNTSKPIPQEKINGTINSISKIKIGPKQIDMKLSPLQLRKDIFKNIFRISTFGVSSGSTNPLVEIRNELIMYHKEYLNNWTEDFFNKLTINFAQSNPFPEEYFNDIVNLINQHQEKITIDHLILPPLKMVYHRNSQLIDNIFELDLN